MNTITITAPEGYRFEDDVIALHFDKVYRIVSIVKGVPPSIDVEEIK